MDLHVDHLVYACADLDQGMKEIEGMLGVCPAMGGRHPDWGTHNALVSLGERQYLEVIAPDPDSPICTDVRPEVFMTQGPGRVTTWAAAASGLDVLSSRVALLGIELGDVVHGSRTRPDGLELNWALTDPASLVLGGVVPFLIDWGSSPHPGAQAPRGCSLVELKLSHPDPPRVIEVLSTLGLDVEVEHAQYACIHAVIDSPMGRVELH